MLEIYQNLPLHLSPIAFSVGLFEVRWYSLMYLVCFLVVYLLLSWRFNHKEFYGTKFKIKFEIIDLMIYFSIGALIGGRLGYVLFYNFQYFLQNPLAIFLPFQLTHTGVVFSGLSGMSYHGGLLGAILAGIIFAKKYHLSFWWLLSWVAPAVPAGYFFGRLGNFLNGELYGRITTHWWGMNFGDNILRHPSQLYEAFFEGFILFLILWIMRNKFSKQLSKLIGFYFIGYATFRFFIEFFRQPDFQLGLILFNFLTMGQLLSIIMVIIGIFIFRLSHKQTTVTYSITKPTHSTRT